MYSDEDSRQQDIILGLTAHWGLYDSTTLDLAFDEQGVVRQLNNQSLSRRKRRAVHQMLENGLLTPTVEVCSNNFVPDRNGHDGRRELIFKLIEPTHFLNWVLVEDQLHIIRQIETDRFELHEIDQACGAVKRIKDGMIIKTDYKTMPNRPRYPLGETFELMGGQTATFVLVNERDQIRQRVAAQVKDFKAMFRRPDTAAHADALVPQHH